MADNRANINSTNIELTEEMLNSSYLPNANLGINSTSSINRNSRPNRNFNFNNTTNSIPNINYTNMQQPRLEQELNNDIYTQNREIINQLNS